VVVDPSPAVKAHAIEVRRRYQLRLPDAIVAATALAHDVPLITADKQFQRIGSLDVLQYELGT
jgi:predicted nucleic acid-binding protein